MIYDTGKYFVYSTGSIIIGGSSVFPCPTNEPCLHKNRGSMIYLQFCYPPCHHPQVLRCWWLDPAIAILEAAIIIHVPMPTVQMSCTCPSQKQFLSFIISELKYSFISLPDVTYKEWQGWMSKWMEWARHSSSLNAIALCHTQYPKNTRHYSGILPFRTKSRSNNQRSAKGIRRKKCNCMVLGRLG